MTLEELKNDYSSVQFHVVKDLYPELYDKITATCFSYTGIRDASVYKVVKVLVEQIQQAAENMDQDRMHDLMFLLDNTQCMIDREEIWTM